MDTLVTVTPPRLNLNGTAGQALFDANRKAAMALYQALDALHATAPHGRDYIGHPEEFEAARREYYDRLTTLNAVLNELDAIAFSIHAQIERRGS